MALKKSSELAQAPQVQAPQNTQAPEAPQAPQVPEAEKVRTKDVDKKKFYADFKNQGIELMKAEKEQGVVYGAMSDKVAYLYALGNPANEGTRSEKGTTDIPVVEVVGYKLKALADIQVPVINREGIAKCDIMGYKEVKWVPVKAGQEFDLTRGELGLMIQLPEYNGMFSGDPNNIVEVQVTVSKAAGNAYVPLSVLKKTYIDENTTPIKANIANIAVKKAGATGKSIKDFEVLPDYAEKYGYIYEEVRSAGRASGERSYSKRERGQTAAELAAALRAYARRTN